MKRKESIQEPPVLLSSQSRPAGTKCQCRGCGQFLNSDLCQCDYSPENPLCDKCGKCGTHCACSKTPSEVQ
jgi:hypothetical protein